MTQITIKIPEDLYQKIEVKRAQDNKPNKTVVINDILDFYFEEVEPQT